ncbi:cobalamin B12-binding domain-containing protein [Crassaminicella thermophila]|uniref:Cobalamin B12-binding domain-containing protein n=1 Tax=Crassaminicella thermophila TaxID=2599308 RepID=A0A5C0SDG8_CRATE|nr:cobalamin B12-binding domain-containing protein [Crassaminicella thermophila]QEK11284.1 cobalamin B12-binding domain-containing protein [Crassaminicella thermophila]
MKKFLGAAIGNCVHVGGVVNFLRLAEEEGNDVEFLGAAVSIEKLIDNIIYKKPDVVTIGFRLTPGSVVPLLNELKEFIDKKKLYHIEWIFGGTKPVAEIAKEYKFFSKIFDGTEDLDDVINYLRGKNLKEVAINYPQNIIERINSKYPYPVIRHHFGLPSLKETYEGIKKIAQAKVLDVISIGPDQNAQENFFTPENMNHDLDGAGGVPLRKVEDFEKLYEASRRGNYPLLRCYSGTAEIFRFAELLKNTINNAWCAVPLCWYNVLDKRGPRDVLTSITEGQKLMKWHAQRNIPVEVNEAHHWSLRDAHDTIGVVMAFLAAYNAKKMGVKHYIAQYMFNVPPAIYHRMDLAKMLAKIQLIESLEDENFKTYRQVRAGLASLSADLDVAKGQLSASTYLAMSIKPHIIHVVGFSEADHAAKPEDVIESCKIVRGVIRSTLHGMVDMTQDKAVQDRKNELVEEAKILLNTIKSLYPESKDPWSDPSVLADIIKRGIIDAPHLRGNKHANGTLETRIVDGKCMAYSKKLGRVVSERERLIELLNMETDKSFSA